VRRDGINGLSLAHVPQLDLVVFTSGCEVESVAGPVHSQLLLVVTIECGDVSSAGFRVLLSCSCSALPLKLTVNVLQGGHEGLRFRESHFVSRPRLGCIKGRGF